MENCPPGRQVEITYNDQRATVVEVGGGIRRYEVGNRSVFDPYPIDSMCDGGVITLEPGQSVTSAWGAHLT